MYPVAPNLIRDRWTRRRLRAGLGCVLLALIAGALAGCGVANPNSASPVADAGGPYAGNVGSSVTFNGTASSDPIAQSLTYAWNFGDGATGSGAIVSHSYEAAGSFAVTLTVTNADKLSATTHTTASILPRVTVTAVSGRVFGGQQPVSGATVQLWQVGATGYGTGAAPLGSSVLTDGGGNFNITGDYSCANGASGGNTLVYITASQGNPGLAPGTNNTALLLMSALGTCGSLGASTIVQINEVTTVATVYALAQFMNPSGGIGSPAASTQGLANAFATVNNLVSIPYGGALTLTPNGNGAVPQSKLNTLGDVLAPCVNSSGPGSMACVALFGATTPQGGTPATNTVGAALNIALNPWSNAGGILGLPDGNAPFIPKLTSVNDWTITIGYASGGGIPASLAVDGTGDVWIANYGTGGTNSSVSFISPLGVPAANSPYSSATAINGVQGIAIDPSGNAWIANHDNSSGAELNATANGPTVSVGTVSGPYTGLSSPTSVGVDGSANVWFVDNGSNSLTELNHANYAGTPTSYSSVGLNGPQRVAFDDLGNAWVTDTTGAAVTKINPATTPAGYTNYTGGGLTNPAGIAIDGSANIWVTDASLSEVAELNSLGGAVSASTGIAVGGVTSASVDAIDGNGNVWIADKSGNWLTELNSSGVALTTATGYQDVSLSAPVGLAIDASGNVWVANSSPVMAGTQALTVSEVVGAAAPAVVPLSLAVQQGLLGQKPGTALPPIANPGGPYAGTAGVAVALSAAASTDPKSEVLTYAWNFGDSGGGTGPTPTHVYAAAGTYTVTLTVTDTDGLTGSASTTVVVAAAPLLAPVVATGGPYAGTAYAPVTFTAAGSYDPANVPAGAGALTITWNFGDGGTGAGPTPVHTYTGPGTFTVTVNAQTAEGGTATATTTATIAAGTPPAGAPTANPGGPYTGAPGVAVAFNGSGSSDPNNLALTYSWSFGDGGTSTAPNPTYAYASGGSYSVVLTVSNGTTQSTASTVATITIPALAPLVVNPGGPYSVPVMQPLAFDGTATNTPSGRQLTYAWDFGDGSSGTGSNPIHLYGKQGTYTVHLSVNDGASLSGNAATQATVTGPGAEVVTANAGGPYQNVTGQTIIFSGAASSDNLGNTLTYSWNFGDGSTGTGMQPSHAYATAGSYTVSVTASSGTASATATASVSITTAIGVAITLPTPNALFGTNTITVSGTVSGPNLSVSVNGVAAQMSGTSFTATGVSLREGVNLISATATDGNGGIGTGVVSVILDATAPSASITSPVSGSTVSTSQIAVAGLVNDIVTGTIGSNNVTVTVNGQAAQVANGSYLLSSLQLVPGTNTITVVATDMVGNTGQTAETVELLPPTSQLSLVKLSGDGQTAQVQGVLAQPLVVQLVSAAGTPVTGRPITFTVTRSDGVVEVMPNSAQTLTVTSDASGKASVLFKLGSRSGLGINQVSATTPGAVTALFTETSTTGPPTQVHAVQGDSQRGLLGEQLAEALQAIVQDASGNPVPGVTVNYTAVGASDGTFDNPAPVTDSNGKVYANLTLGQQEGIGNYVTEADFTGDTGNPVSFVASAFAPGPVANTSVSGVVLDNSNNPVPNATVTIAGTTLSTVTNTSGNFQINGAPVGTVTFTVDGSTATTTETLPFLSFVLEDLPGQNNTLNKPIYLPAIDVNDAQTVGGSNPVTLTMANVPGVAFTVAPNSVTFPDGSTVGNLSLSQVKSDQVPMEPSNGTAPNLVWTLQPAGTRFSVPVQVTLPNSLGLPPGYVSEMYQYDHDLEQFVSAGTGHVSADGSVIVSDPGFGITKAGWGHGGTPNSPFGCVQSCTSVNPCVSATYSPSHCLCIKKILVNQTCGAYIDGGIVDDGVVIVPSYNLSCQGIGHCDANGNCTGTMTPAKSPCRPAQGSVCDISYVCNGNGKCLSTGTVKDVTTTDNPSQDYGSINAAVTRFTDPINTLLKATGSTLSMGFSVSGSRKTTMHCCRETNTANVPITDTALAAALSLGGTWPVTIPTEPPVPLGIVFPDGTTGGFTATPSVTDTLTLTGHVDNCNTNGNCLTLALSGELKLTLTIALPIKIINISASGSFGVTNTLTAGCGAITATSGLSPIVATGKVMLGSGFDYSVTRTLYTPTTVYTVTIPLQ